MTQHTLIENAKLICPETEKVTNGSVLLQGNIIQDISTSPQGIPEGAKRIDAKGLHLCPGLIDMRAFLGEPGAEHRETFQSASQAAAAGGVTTLIAQPDTTPVVDDPAIVDFLLRRARDKSLVKIYPMAALTKGMAGEEMSEIGLLKDAGAVAFTDGAHTIMNTRVFRQCLNYAKDFDALIVHHTEDAYLKGNGVMNQGALATRLGLSSIPKEAETILLSRDLALAQLTKARYHAAAISCAQSAQLIANAKQDANISASVTINHLTLNENDIGNYRTFFKLTPPLRSEDDRMALVQALNDGTIDVIVSDHNPQDVETKRLPFAEAANGAIGIETMLSAALRLYHSEHISLPKLIKAMTLRPAQLLNLPQGRLKKGAPADLVLFDAYEPWVLNPLDLKSISKNTPFDEQRMEGKVKTTWVNGQIVHNESI